MKTTVFTGEYFERGATRKLTTTDPATNAVITKLVKHDVVRDLVIDRVSGFGPSEKTGEMQITLAGQYKQGCKTCRITAFAQDVEKVQAMLKGNVVKSDELPFMLKDEIVVTAIGDPMKGYGLSLTELYLKTNDGQKTIIAAPEQTVGGEQSKLADAFL